MIVHTCTCTVAKIIIDSCYYYIGRQDDDFAINVLIFNDYFDIKI